MKNLKRVFIAIAAILFFTSCEDNDDAVPRGGANSDINEFIYQGLDAFYLFREEQEVFTNPPFSGQRSFENFAANGGSPEAFFEQLTVTQDRFSLIVPDFTELERQFTGTTLETGLEFLAFLYREGSDDVYLVTTRVAAGSSADRAGIKRGDIFNRINGQILTRTNFGDLFDENSFTLGGASVQNNSLVNNSNVVSLVKEQLNEKTVPVEKIIETDNAKIGYLFYRSFIRESEQELNEVFKRFKANNIDELVLDLRYNGGGSIRTAIALASMITGQFDNQVLIKEQWNPQIQQEFLDENPESLVSRFVNTIGDDNEPIASLNLDRVHIIMTKRQTASASELVINGLKPYIDVVTYGNGSVGKSQASITLYDSPSLFLKENINPDHTYAMQPLVFRSINNDDVIVPNEGLKASVALEEDIQNLGELGELSDPILNRVINDINGVPPAIAKNINSFTYEIIGSDQDPSNPLYQSMYK